MATTYKTPGVYVEEISKLPPSVAQVETAIPAFIGYTANDTYRGLTLVSKPKRIKALTEFIEVFGTAKPAAIKTGSDGGIKIKKINGEFQLDSPLADPFATLSYRLYYSLQLYFGNGGGPCWIVSCGKYKNNDTVVDTEMEAALTALRKEDEPTMIVFTDAVSLTDADKYYGLQIKALNQSAELMDRVAIIDLHLSASDKGEADFSTVESDFRAKIGINSLSYGVAYYPWLRTTLDYAIDESAISILRGANVTSAEIPDGTMLRKYPPDDTTVLPTVDAQISLYHVQSSIYAMIKKEIAKFQIISPPSPAIAGVYAMVDSTRGVWKAPANVSLNYVKEPAVKIDDLDQRDMNVTVSG